jgi:26S proteasome regulatory subunit N8
MHCACVLVLFLKYLILLEEVRDRILNFLWLVQVTGKLTALKGLDARLKEIHSYLDLVIDGKIPLNHEILYHLQVHF